MSSVNPTRHKRGSVQRHFVELRSVRGPHLCLAASGSGQASLVSVLQIEGITYDLLSEGDREQLVELYQRFLSALTFPVQILWQALPLDLDAYLRPFLPPDTTRNAASLSVRPDVPDQPASDAVWEKLAASHVAFMQQVGARRTLLSRRMYLIVRAERVDDQAHTTGWLSFTKRSQREQEALSQTRQTLEMRVAELTRLLEAMGLSVRQLSGPEELIPFYASLLAPQRARHVALQAPVIAGLDRPVVCAHSSFARTGETHDAPQVPFPSSLPTPEEKPSHPARQKKSQRHRHGSTDTISERLDTLCDLARAEDLVAPACIAVAPDLLRIEEEYARIITVHQLPRVVAAGWLKPLMELDEPLCVSIHLHPLDQAVMVRRFRRRLTDYQSSRLAAGRAGQTLDPHIRLAESDVADLIERLVSGEERMLSLSMHLLVRAPSKRGLQERTERVLSVLHSLLLVARVAYFEQEQGFRSLLPHARNHLGTGILLDSRSASTMLPFLSGGVFHPDGILEGITPAGDPVVLDGWHEQLPNANRIMLGPPGWGKSYWLKASLMRLALKYSLPRIRERTSPKEQAGQAFQVIVIDPEREYGRVAEALEGQVIVLSPGSTHRLNPFDLPAPTSGEDLLHGDKLSDHLQTLHALLDIMLADRTPEGGQTLTSTEKGLLDRALFETYRRVGITSDPRTHDRPAPLMRDLYAVLESGVCGPDPTGLTQRLGRYVVGSLSGLFAGPTNVNLRASVIVFDVHDLETELRPVGLLLVSNFVWKESFGSRIPRQLVVDEAATLYQYASGAHFLEDLVRRARKYYLGVTVISQHPLLFRDSSIIANCAIHLLLHQDATALDLIRQMFKLSTREVQVLRRLSVGEALLLVGEQHLQVRCEVSALEHQLATTNPRELAARQKLEEQTDGPPPSAQPTSMTIEPESAGCSLVLERVSSAMASAGTQRASRLPTHGNEPVFRRLTWMPVPNEETPQDHAERTP